jgi:hypothetical protein
LSARDVVHGSQLYEMPTIQTSEFRAFVNDSAIYHSLRLRRNAIS